MGVGSEGGRAPEEARDFADPSTVRACVERLAARDNRVAVTLYTTAGLICLAVSVATIVLLVAALKAPATRWSESLAALARRRLS